MVENSRGFESERCRKYLFWFRGGKSLEQVFLKLNLLGMYYVGKYQGTLGKSKILLIGI
jgi:hypothetical protein